MANNLDIIKNFTDLENLLVYPKLPFLFKVYYHIFKNFYFI